MDFDTSITLCTPFPETTCFGCCPPIRPVGYDHLDYASSLQREFRENRRRLLVEGPNRRPIVGYSCWALGYLDSSGRRIGCLLHPLQNDGEDLRHLIDYEGKCGREHCMAAEAFEPMPIDAKEFWLGLASGLDSFLYSSPRANPMFHLLLWNSQVLKRLRREAWHHGWSVTESVHRRPFLLDRRWQPRAHRYLFRIAMEYFEIRGVPVDEGKLEATCENLIKLGAPLPGAIPETAPPDEIYPIHHLPIPEDYQDFLRLALKISKGSWGRIHRIRQELEGALEHD